MPATNLPDLPMLTSKQIAFLRARAHHLDPVVIIGNAGLTANVLHEIDQALARHELIKIRISGDDREARQALRASICSQTGAECVGQIGKIMAVYRQAEKPRIELPPA